MGSVLFESHGSHRETVYESAFQQKMPIEQSEEPTREQLPTFADPTAAQAEKELAALNAECEQMKKQLQQLQQETLDAHARLS